MSRLFLEMCTIISHPEPSRRRRQFVLLRLRPVEPLSHPPGRTRLGTTLQNSLSHLRSRWAVQGHRHAVPDAPPAASYARSPGRLGSPPLAQAVRTRADIQGKRTQPTVCNGCTSRFQIPVITPLSLMLSATVWPATQNGGANKVTVPSGDRTKP